MTLTASISIGDADLVAEYTVSGCYHAATMIDPAEFPEIEIVGLLTAGGENVRGLLEFTGVYEHVMEQLHDRESETNYGRDPDPDDAYERWREARDERREMGLLP